METPPRTGSATVVAGVSLLGVAATIAADGIRGAPTATLGGGLSALTAAWLGWIIVVRRPGHRIGWLLLTTGLLSSAHLATTSYALTGLSRSWPASTGAAWYATWGFAPVFILLLVVLPLTFPDGRLVSPRWRPVAWASVLFAAGSLVAAFGAPMLSPGGQDLPLPNPLYIPSWSPVWTVLDVAVMVGFFPLLLAAAAAPVVRYRRASALERQQLRWLAAGASLVPVLFAVSILPAAERFDPPLLGVVPAAVGVAVLRYRLYDLGRLVRRTLAYTIVTAILAGLYLTVVLVTQQVLRPVTSGSQLAVAASTLVVAAAFGPVRRQVQAMIDRRFDRRRYDAHRAATRLAILLRDEVEPSSVAAALTRVVTTTLQPASVGIVLSPAPTTLDGVQPSSSRTSSPGEVTGRSQARSRQT